MKLGAIEAGGTKFVLSIGDELGNIFSQIKIPTLDPVTTLDKCIEFFQNSGVEAIGIGSFGPVNINPKSPLYGTILNTPKTKWINFNVKAYLEKSLHMPIYFETDVDVACYGEYKHSFPNENILYITVGTGVGCGYILNGKLLYGFSNPEMGHIVVEKHQNDHGKSVCPYHSNCLEGLASGPSIEARYGKKGEELASDLEVWDLEGYYLAQACQNYLYILTPDHIVFGGGVGLKEEVLDATRKYLKLMNKDYVDIPNNFIVAATLGSNAGTIGSLYFAYDKFIGKI